MAVPLDLETYLDAASAIIDLPIAPDYRAEVLANLQRTAAIAAAVLEFPLADEEAEAASVFCPGETE
ncbi:DUF4089 domain-containing protein [Parvibaculum sp.]|uniref:DUF4089 domain-containing protein n=1 Tax=Parvibaculum sp. TaxID=2024848 RepID=UPI003210DF1D